MAASPRARARVLALAVMLGSVTGLAGVAVVVPGGVAAARPAPAGSTTCPAAPPAATGELDVLTSSARTYAGFAPDSSVVLCFYGPRTVLDVTRATPDGEVGLPSRLAPNPSAPGSHRYVLLGVGPTGRTVALAQEVVGPVAVDVGAPQAQGTPTPTPTATPFVTTAAPSGIDVVVAITGTSGPGDGGGPGGGGGPGSGGGPAGGDGSGVLARTGGLLGLLAGGLGLALLVAGLVVVRATRRGGRPRPDVAALR